MADGRRNILIASAGEKTGLVTAFRQSARGEMIFAACGDPLCAAGAAADGLLIFDHGAPGARAAISALCEEHGIGLIVPTEDAELGFFAEARPALEAEGTHVLAPSPETLAVCGDVRRFGKTLERYGYPAIPVLHPASAPDLPVYARPADMTLGPGRRIETADDLAALPDDWVLHPLVAAPEIAIDLLMDLEGGRPVQAVARERVLVIGGESRVSRVVEAKEAVRTAMRLGAALGLTGHNMIRAFLCPERGPLLTRIAPRFGAGSLLSVSAGLNSPERILQMLRGEEIAYVPRQVRAGETLLRHSHDVVLPGVTA